MGAYEELRAKWESPAAQRGRDRRRDKHEHSIYPLVKSRPHVVSAQDFIAELNLLSWYRPHPAFWAAYAALHEINILDEAGHWRRDFRPNWSEFANRVADGGYAVAANDARKELTNGKVSERVACARAVAQYNLPGHSFYACVKKLRQILHEKPNVTFGGSPEVK